MAHKVQINATSTGTVGVKLPNGQTYLGGQTAVLTDEEFAILNPLSLTDGTLTDLGELGPTGDSVTTQGNAVSLTSSAPSALTSSQNTTTAVVTTTPTTGAYGYTLTQAQEVVALVNALQTSYNALQTDVAALRTVVAELVVDITALNTNLSGAGKALV